jgi:DNA-binding NtrC family response regulator
VHCIAKKVTISCLNHQKNTILQPMKSDKTVLIIDDETDLCLLLKDYFTRKKFTVTIAHTLLDGINSLHRQQPDILLLDYNLADGIGWNQAPVVADLYPQTYIILISAFNTIPPPLPEGTKFSIMEKPISFADLNNQFAGYLALS